MYFSLALRKREEKKKQIFRTLADYARTKGRLTTTQVRKLFTCGSYACQFIFMSLTALFMTSGGAGAVTCISLSLGCGGK